jgi:hypothetical protein
LSESEIRVGNSLLAGGTALPKLRVNAAVVAAELFELGDDLKAAIVVSAAALLSRRGDDLEANAHLVVARLQEMHQKLNDVRNGVLERKGVSIIARLRGRTKDIDSNRFTEATNLIDDRIDSYKDVFRSVLESKDREGIDVFARRVGALGRAIQDAIGLVAGNALMGSPFLFDALFAQTMEELSGKRWDDGAC